MQSPHQPLVNGEGPLGDGGDGCQACGVVLAVQGGDGVGHLLTLEHLALQAPVLQRQSRDFVTEEKRKNYFNSKF